jgi:hypothetical protein
MTNTLHYASPSQAPGYPIALKVVAWLFIIFGVLAVLEIVAALFAGRVSLNVGVLGIFVGRGILRLRRGWRTCALVLLWLCMIIVSVVAVMILAGAGKMTLFGTRVGRHEALVFGLPLTLGYLALGIWQYRVLTRPDVRRLFGLTA